MTNSLQRANNVDSSPKLLSILQTTKELVHNAQPLDGLYYFLYFLLICTIHLFQSTWYKFEEIKRFTRISNTLFHAEVVMSTEQWVECVKIVIQSPMADQIPEQFYDDKLCGELFYALHIRSVPLSDRLDIIKAFLDAGVHVFSEDVDIAFQVFGYREELETVMFHPKCNIGFYHECEQPLQSFIFCWEEEINSEAVSRLYHNLICSKTFLSDCFQTSVIIKTLGYFSLSHPAKKAIKEEYQAKIGDCGEILQVLDQIPTCPTLVELSRNVVYNTLVGSPTGRKKAFEFHNSILGLNIPLPVKDVLRFKQAIYL